MIFCVTFIFIKFDQYEWIDELERKAHKQVQFIQY